MSAPVPFLDLRFPHTWQAEVLPARPLILPARHFVYPREVEEVERGALEVLVRPGAPGLDSETRENMSANSSVQPFLATCALGFRDPIVPTGLWSTPDPQAICAVSGGYAYLIDTSAPELFGMVPYRPVLEVRAEIEAGLLLFVSNKKILAWGSEGQAWESEKLSDEGITISGVENGVLRGVGWNMWTDKEGKFEIDLATGKRAL